MYSFGRRPGTLRTLHKRGFPSLNESLLRQRTALVSSKATLNVEHLSGSNAGITVVSMNNPKVNALSHALVNDMRELLPELKANGDIRVVVLRSELENVFCAGADLKQRNAMSVAEGRQFVIGLRALMDTWERLPQPVIAAMDGAAFGGGMELALACDLRVATPTATMGLIETSRGLVPGAGGTQRLARVVGMPLAKELIFTARKFDGRYAAQIGAVNRLCASGSPVDDALELAREILANAPIAVCAAKQALNEGFAATDSDMAIEKRAYDVILPTKDRKLAMEAFIKKETPVWTNS